jgi:hypothetical protein
LHGQQRAGLHRLAVEQDGTGAANARFAANVSASQFAVVAQVVNEEGARLDRVLVFDSVDANVGDGFHVFIGNQPLSW